MTYITKPVYHSLNSFSFTHSPYFSFRETGILMHMRTHRHMHEHTRTCISQAAPKNGGKQNDSAWDGDPCADSIAWKLCTRTNLNVRNLCTWKGWYKSTPIHT